jgi:hypothetical protein
MADPQPDIPVTEPKDSLLSVIPRGANEHGATKDSKKMGTQGLPRGSDIHLDRSSLVIAINIDEFRRVG